MYQYIRKLVDCNETSGDYDPVIRDSNASCSKAFSGSLFEFEGDDVECERYCKSCGCTDHSFSDRPVPGGAPAIVVPDRGEICRVAPGGCGFGVETEGDYQRCKELEPSGYYFHHAHGVRYSKLAPVTSAHACAACSLP